MGINIFGIVCLKQRGDVEQGLQITLDTFTTRDQQEHALNILQFKLDILWTMLDAMTMAYVHNAPPYHNIKYKV